MLKNFLTIVMLMFLLMPALASAANMQVNSSAVPVSGGTITPSGIKFYGPLSTDAQRTYTVAPKSGWTLKSVLIDGVGASGAQVIDATHYTVPFDTSKVHTVKANFAQTLYSITTTAGTGGSIQVTGGGVYNITPGSTRGYVVAPYGEYTIATCLVDGVAAPATGSFANIQGNHTIVVTFSPPPPPSCIPVIPAGYQDQIIETPCTNLCAFVSDCGTIHHSIRWSGTPGLTFTPPDALCTTVCGMVVPNGVYPNLATKTYTATAIVDGVVTDPVNIFVVPAGILSCSQCHIPQGTAYKASIHFTGVANSHSTCADCHNSTTTTPNDTHNGYNVNTGTVNPATFLTLANLSTTRKLPVGTVYCTMCHNGAFAIPHQTTGNMTNCVGCHTPGGTGDVHNITSVASGSCIQCHASAANAGPGFVQDNNGVRAITQEFTKWSHHVTGVTLQDAHCAACHLEGKAVNGVIVVDSAYHMADAYTHLRNSDSDADFVWDPATPNHTNMDNFCMSCHDANGATSTGSKAIRSVLGVISSASNTHAKMALNPFNDTISNQYDKMLRGRVVDVDSQFTTTNMSHHAVKGKKYSGRTREQGDPRSVDLTKTPTGSFASYSGALVFANTSSTYGSMVGTRETIYEAARFVATYKTLSPAVGTDYSLGDDSTLHCGDCHTVGQWKAGSSVNVDGTPTVAVIGAHGSNNEYMLRVSNGADALHRGAQYSYNPANMLGKSVAPVAYNSAFDYSATNGVPAANVAGDFAGMTFGPFPTGLPHTLVNIANQAVPASEVPESQPFLVCYNCHVYTEYGSVFFSNTAQGGREGSHTFGDHTRGNYCNGPYNTSGSGRATTYTAVYGPQVSDVNPTGVFMTVANFNYGRLKPGVATVNPATGGNFSGAANTAAVWCSATVLNNLELKTQGLGFGQVYDLRTGALAVANPLCNDPSGATGTLSKFTTTQLAFQGMNGSGAGGSNLFQIQCASCHNSGAANGFGGIHGSKINTYTSAAGQTTNARRFLPGLGNAKWVPGDPGAIEAMQWEQEGNANGGSTSGHQPGCYTLSTVVGAPGGNQPLPAASEGGTTPGTNSGQLFGTWGSCTDHNNVDGLERTMIRPVSY